jgi:3-hydroxyacyl-[acyl-carrier-protein] dehydratase
MRFIFVDRIVALDAGRSIETLKNVSSTEDVFNDHFPGFPILPGALIIELFSQSAQLLIGATYDFERVGRLVRLSSGSFRQFVRPGDQLRARCECRLVRPRAWSVAASASVDGRRVALATLEFAVEKSAPRTEAGEQAERLKTLLRVLGRPSEELIVQGSVL